MNQPDTDGSRPSVFSRYHPWYR